MQKEVKISHSFLPFPSEVVEDIVIQVFGPYSDKNVTLQINPNIQDYQENADQ